MSFTHAYYLCRYRKYNYAKTASKMNTYPMAWAMLCDPGIVWC